MKTTTMIMLLAFVSTARAQEVKQQEVRYDSAIISYYLAKDRLYVSINGKESTDDTAVFRRTVHGEESLSPFIRKIQEFESQGWLCIDIVKPPAASGRKAYLAYLRKKKQL